MKRLLLFIILTATFMQCFAQKDDAIVLPDKLQKTEPVFRSRVLAFYPGFWAPGIKFESASANQKVSYGVHVRGYIFLFNGAKFEPFVRVYFKGNAPQGLFMQFKLSASLYNANSVLFRGFRCYTTSTGQQLCPGDPGYVKQNDWRYFFGGGVATGYQFLLGEKKRFALDLYGGIQVIIPKNRLGYDEDLYLWMARGFPLELGLRMGWAF
jgi:hypothetical protein